MGKRISFRPGWRACLLAAIMLLIAGCGPRPPRLVPVSGTVLSQGEPVTAGSVIFHPQSSAEYQDDAPSSLLQLDGSFTMKTFPFGEGVAPGEYTVTLSPELATRLKASRFSRPTESPWKIVVPDEGLRDVILELP